MLKSWTAFTACACACNSAGEAAAGSLAIASVARSACASIRQNSASNGESTSWKCSDFEAATKSKKKRRAFSSVRSGGGTQPGRTESWGD